MPALRARESFVPTTRLNSSHLIVGRSRRPGGQFGTDNSRDTRNTQPTSAHQTQTQEEGNLIMTNLRSRIEFNLVLMNLLYPFIIIAVLYFLPFAHVHYLVQKLEPNVNIGSIEVGAEELPLNVYLFQCLGGICGEQKMMIEAKMADILNAGNSASTPPDPTQENNFIVMLNSLSQGLGTLFGDDNNMRDKTQVRLFAYAGVLVILLLLIASTLASISFLVLAVSRLSRQCKRSATPKKVVEFSTEFIACLLLGATVLYPATIWKQMRSSGSSFGSGYIVMAMLTARMHLGSLMMRGLKAMGVYIRSKKEEQRQIESSPTSVSQEANMII